jgi:hypothetical protein
MMIKVRDIYRLVDYQVKHFTRSWIIVGNDSANSSIGFSPKGRVISNNLYRSVKV